jgi:hypothetical protein
MGRFCSAHGRVEMYIQGLVLTFERDHLEDLLADGNRVCYK